MPESLNWTHKDEANQLLATDPLALMIGMLLDHPYSAQIP